MQDAVRIHESVLGVRDRQRKSMQVRQGLLSRSGKQMCVLSSCAPDGARR